MSDPRSPWSIHCAEWTEVKSPQAIQAIPTGVWTCIVIVMLDLKYLFYNGLRYIHLHWMPFCTITWMSSKAVLFQVLFLEIFPRGNKVPNARWLDWMTSNFFFWIHLAPVVTRLSQTGGDNAHHGQHCTFFPAKACLADMRWILKPFQSHSVTLLGQTDLCLHTMSQRHFSGKEKHLLVMPSGY